MTGIYVGTNAIKNVYIGTTPVKSVYVGTTKVRPKVYPYLCFTANTAGSTVQLTKVGSPTSVTLETSTDGENWNNYTIGNTITLSNVGDKIYWRNTSTTTTGFSIGTSKYYKFVMTGSIAGSGDTNYLLNKNSTTTVSNYAFYKLFYNNSSLTTAPELPATSLAPECYWDMFYLCTNLVSAPKELPATALATDCYREMFNQCTKLVNIPSLMASTLSIACYYGMFGYCTSLEKLPALPATTFANACYGYMFQYCTKIKLSTTQTGAYQTAYRIPNSGTGTSLSYAFDGMFNNTGGTFTGTPSVNTTYYTSNTVV